MITHSRPGTRVRFTFPYDPDLVDYGTIEGPSEDKRRVVVRWDSTGQITHCSRDTLTEKQNRSETHMQSGEEGTAAMNPEDWAVRQYEEIMDSLLAGRVLGFDRDTIPEHLRTGLIDAIRAIADWVEKELGPEGTR